MLQVMGEIISPPVIFTKCCPTCNSEDGDGVVKHQITLRRLLLYVALFAVGMGALRFGFTSDYDATFVATMFGVAFVSLAVCCPIGYVIAGTKGELNAVTVAVALAVPVGMCLVGYLNMFLSFPFKKPPQPDT